MANAVPTPVPASDSRALDIMFLDDNASSRALMEISLQSRGHRVLCARSVREAAGLLRTFVFDLIICDLNLPDGTGLDVAGHIPPGQKVHKIILSGYGDVIDVHRTLAAGFDAHLVKPLDMAALQRTVRKLTGRPL